ncbi:LemA protein [Halorientalis persicus]|jgi:LemA protein|uniref:LemA protein n=1 Tax=Halorientalis persicus TaxID=1367881 RepID=A0A1H8I965_9EURY|nr:LemA family protein [Halorientalis persicus]SEN64418.1 LemA protein [Halorientalis persicus]
MVDFATVVLGFGLVVLAYSVVKYLGSAHNNVVEAHERCEKAWSDIDVLLERRAGEVGDLIDLTREHVSHEQDVLEDVIEARERVVEASNPDEAADAVVALRSSLDEVYDLSTEYPDLASSERFDELSDSIRTIEQRIENRREQYNDAVRAYNTRLKRVPERFVADYYGYTSKTPFVASASAREGVDVGDRLSLSDED